MANRSLYTANVDGNVDIYLYDIAIGNARALALPKGLNCARGQRLLRLPAMARACFTRTRDRPLPATCGSTRLPTARRINSRIRWWAACARRTWSSRIWSTIPARMASGPSPRSFTFLTIFPRNGEHPAIVYVHGGPTSQTMNTFNRFVQYMANQGYLVIAPNYRGSTGYGKEFQQANLFDMGGGDLQDVLAAADWIKQTGYVDPKKVILMGGSYGGYLTMMGVTKAPEMWAAGVPIVPFVNWFTEIQNEDPVLQQSDLATMGDPVKNKALYEDRSPINFVDRIKAPLYLLAGGNDPRCPKSEAQQVVDAVKKRGGVAEYKVYEDEGHGFSRVENQIDAYKRVADFLKAHVPPADCGCTLNE